MTRTAHLFQSAGEMVAQFDTVVREAKHMRDVRLPVSPCDWYVDQLDNFGWSMHWGYIVTEEGMPNSRPDMGPDADGVRTEIEIVDAVLVGKAKIDLPLSMFTCDQLAEARDEIEEKLNR